MSYPIDLDEYATSTLVAELKRRKTRRALGKCHYCGRALCSSPMCKIPAAHQDVEEELKMDKLVIK